MNEPTTPTDNGRAAKPNGRPRPKKVNLQDMTALIEQSMKLRAALHSLLHEANGLTQALKQHRRQSRALENTIAQLRQLGV